MTLTSPLFIYICMANVIGRSAVSVCKAQLSLTSAYIVRIHYLHKWVNTAVVAFSTLIGMCDQYQSHSITVTLSATQNQFWVAFHKSCMLCDQIRSQILLLVKNVTQPLKLNITAHAVCRIPTIAADRKLSYNTNRDTTQKGDAGCSPYPVHY